MNDPAPAAPPAAFRLGPRLAAVLLIVAGLLAYANSFSGPFVLDDIASIVENPSIRRLGDLGAVFAPPAGAGVGGRPVANFSFALNYAMSGTAVGSYHALNLALHLTSVLILFGIVRRMLALPVLEPRLAASLREPAAFAIALLWLLHPLHTGAVTYISQRTELLMALCYLATLYTFVRGSVGRQSRWFPLAIAICTLGMATKEVMVTAPVMVLLFDRTFVAGSFRAAWQQRRTFYLLLAASWLLLAFLLPGLRARGISYVHVSWWSYLLTEANAVLHYLRLAIWPFPQVFDYGQHLNFTLGETIFSAGIVGAALVAIGFALWQRPLLGFAVAWPVLILAPTSSVVPVAASPMSEHRMYLPLAGIIALIAIAATTRIGRRGVVAICALAILFGFITHRRNADYRSVEILWRDTISKAPANARAHAALAETLLRAGRVTEAIASFQTALQYDPRDAKAHNNAAAALQELGRLPEAIAHFQASAQLEPTAASTHYNLGNVLLEVGRAAEAAAAQQQALALQPNLAVAHGGLANALTALGRPDEAIAHYNEALRLDPQLAPAHFALANLFANSGQFANAVPHYEATARLLPQSPDAHFRLANALALSGRFPEAIRQYETALALKPDFEAAKENLAKVRAAAGAKPG